MSSILSIDKITKLYGPIKALDNVSFDVPKGSVFGILGPNGSGKTTLLGIVMDILKASSGSFLWNGQPGSETIRQRIGHGRSVCDVTLHKRVARIVRDIC